MKLNMTLQMSECLYMLINTMNHNKIGYLITKKNNKRIIFKTLSFYLFILIVMYYNKNNE